MDTLTATGELDTYEVADEHVTRVDFEPVEARQGKPGWIFTCSCERAWGPYRATEDQAQEDARTHVQHVRLEDRVVRLELEVKELLAIARRLKARLG